MMTDPTPPPLTPLLFPTSLRRSLYLTPKAPITTLHKREKVRSSSTHHYCKANRCKMTCGVTTPGCHSPGSAKGSAITWSDDFPAEVWRSHGFLVGRPWVPPCGAHCCARTA